MNEGSQRQGFHLSFQPTITLGTVVHIVFLAVLLVAAWTRISDRLSADEDKISAQQQVLLQQSTISQQTQIQLTRTDAILDGVEKELARDENQAAQRR